MVKFMIQFFLAVAILFVGVLLGMQQANEGLTKMKGYDDPAFQEVFHFSESSKGEIEASILGSTVTSEDIEEKKKKLEEMKTFNIFSELGKHLADFIQLAVEQLLYTVGKLFSGEE
jgi:hypothetical protein